jgi:hypothetical protein
MTNKRTFNVASTKTGKRLQTWATSLHLLTAQPLFPEIHFHDHRISFSVSQEAAFNEIPFPYKLLVFLNRATYPTYHNTLFALSKSMEQSLSREANRSSASQKIPEFYGSPPNLDLSDDSFRPCDLMCT